ncbi:hypothetical protein BDZ45DRAFT_723342 [Acephala macrosclerotiorum]|nr:hypothetical protein BDZ45DRAFT_723342 [Acephala macrosclerotiorum]
MPASTPLWEILKKEPLPSWMIPQNPAPIFTPSPPTPAMGVPQNRRATYRYVWSQHTAKPSPTVHHKEEEKKENEKSTKKPTTKPRRMRQTPTLFHIHLTKLKEKKAKQKSLLITKFPPEVHLLIFDHLGPASQRLFASTCKPLYDLYRQHYHSNIIHISARATALKPNVCQTYHDVIVISFERDIEATGYTPEFMTIVSKWLGLEGRVGRLAYFKWLREWRKDRQEEAAKEGRKYEVRCFPTLGKSFFEY